MVITLTGANTFALTRELRQLTANFEAEQGDMGLERLDGEEATLERISEALTSVPFLSNKKMVLIRSASANKQFMERAADLLDDVPETTEVVIVEPKLDKRSSYYKYLKKATDYREYNELDQVGLARWLTQLTKEKGGALSQSDASFLVSRVGTNQQLLANELDKLLLYDESVTRASIEALTEPTPQSTIFELLDAAFAGDTKRAMQLYAEQRALKVEPQQIIAMLTWQLHVLALIKTAGERSPQAIASEAKVSPYVVQKSSGISRKLTLAELKRLIANLAEIDARSKRETFSVDDALQHYLLTLGT
ncbi:MAG TPA: DNA polymerase III subunit delta [Candidatus Saccharimonadales bacterium]